MLVTFWGVRGSYPVPGPDTVRYGGHTSCVELRSEEGGCLIFDAGTGMRGLGQKLAAERGDREVLEREKFGDRLAVLTRFAWRLGLRATEGSVRHRDRWDVGRRG